MVLKILYMKSYVLDEGKVMLLMVFLWLMFIK